jgi:serine/threonine-protein kinase
MGCLLYELLTGRVPFEADSAAEVFAGHLYRAAVPPRQLAPERAIPVALDAAVMHALAKLPAERPADARAMREELRAALTGRVDAPRGEGKKQDRGPDAPAPSAAPAGQARVAVLEAPGAANPSVVTALGAAGFTAVLAAPTDALEGFSAVVLVPRSAQDALPAAAALLRKSGIPPVLLCGPEDDLALMTSAIEAGVYDYIPLPLDPVDLSRKVSRAQRKRR